MDPDFPSQELLLSRKKRVSDSDAIDVLGDSSASNSDPGSDSDEDEDAVEVRTI